VPEPAQPRQRRSPASALGGSGSPACGPHRDGAAIDRRDLLTPSNEQIKHSRRQSVNGPRDPSPIHSSEIALPNLPNWQGRRHCPRVATKVTLQEPGQRSFQRDVGKETERDGADQHNPRHPQRDGLFGSRGRNKRAYSVVCILMGEIEGVRCVPERLKAS